MAGVPPRYTALIIMHVLRLAETLASRRSLSPIVNRWFLPHGLRSNSFLYYANRFEIAHAGRRQDFLRTEPRLDGRTILAEVDQIQL